MATQNIGNQPHRHARTHYITQPGKFEGEPTWATYFYSLWSEGIADHDVGFRAYFLVTHEDRLLYPELAGIRRISLTEDANGFVHTRVLS